jgi:quercetin dioxygenase-like cupin family protein
MKKLTILLPFILSFLWQSGAVALEVSATVEVSTLLKTESSWDGKPIEYPSGKAEVTGMVVEIAPGGETGWHSHPIPSFGFVLEGELEVQLRSGAVKRVKPGEALAEVVNTFHNGRNVGSVPLRLVVFYVGSAGQKLSVNESGQ